MTAPFPEELKCKDPIYKRKNAASLPLRQNKNIPEQEENLPVNKTGSSRPGVGSYDTGGTRSYGEISGNDLPPPITNYPKPMQRKTLLEEETDVRGVKTCSVGGCGKPTDPGGPPPPPNPYKRQVRSADSLPPPITTVHPQAKPEDPYNVEPHREERAAEKCKNPDCGLYGSHEKRGYCSKCYSEIRGGPSQQQNYKRQVRSPDSLPLPITTVHPQAKPEDPYNVEPHREERAAEKCKNPDCGLYGSHEKRGYCSKCYSEIRGGPSQQQRRDYPTCPQCHRNEGVEAYGNLCRTCHSQNIHGQPVYNPKIESSQGSGTLQYGEYDRTHYGREDPPRRGADVKGVKTCSVGGCGKPTHPGGDGTMCLDHFYNKRLALSKKCVFSNCGKATDPASGGKLCFDHFAKALDGKLPGFDLSQITSKQEENVPKKQQCKEQICQRKKAPQRMGYCEKCYEDRYLMGGDL